MNQLMKEKNTELLQSVEDLFLDSSKKARYNIPEYQRGYKWSKIHISALFNDLIRFQDDNEKNASENANNFYCLQNITLVKQDGHFNVVDGQQRLTTLLIILAYIKHRINPEITILSELKYSIREDTHDFIVDSILTGKIWDESITSSSAKHIDRYYIIEVANTVAEEFDKLKNKDEFSTHFLTKLKLIVNEICDVKEEHIFANINGAKVSLDGADLMRGLLMTKAAKERFGNTPNGHNVSEFRVRMGMELDQINLWLGQRKEFFAQFIMSQNQKNKQFGITGKAINILYVLYYEYKCSASEKPLNYAVFEYGFDTLANGTADDRWEMYQELKELYATLVSWYDDDEIYHYLGYLMFQFKSKTQFKDIYAKWKKLNSKPDFKSFLKSKIIENITFISSEDEKENISDLESLCKELRDVEADWYSHNKLSQALILMDIIRLNRNERLNAKYFAKQSNEDKEHILPQTPHQEKSDSKQEWKMLAKQHKEEVQTAIQTILEHCEEELTPKQITELNDLIISKIKSINSIGNMSLLHQHINQSYGNAVYAHKRTRIAAAHFSDTYIRPHTLAVFMKSDLLPNKDGKVTKNEVEIKADYTVWTESDIERSAKYIADEINKFNNNNN